MSKSIHTALYKRLRQLLVSYREKGEMTQSELAAAIGKPQSFISKVESGERRLDIVELIQILNALHADPGEFIDELLPGARLFSTDGASASDVIVVDHASI